MVLGLFVIRPILTSSNRRTELPAPDVILALPTAEGFAPEVLTGEIDDGPDPALPNPEDQPLDPVERLRRLIAERQAESVEILRGWMEHEEEAS
jgi:flagellar M-ring protein FliF